MLSHENMQEDGFDFTTPQQGGGFTNKSQILGHMVTNSSSLFCL